MIHRNKIINIGIFAHVDAGKTTITENLLFECGVLKEIGRVDNGNTRTDTMAQEKERGISIQAAPISFQIDDLKVNLIDTPGHVDFVAEVERTINILDGAILVLSAKEGLQAHTYLLFNSLKKLGIPVIFFINKIDRPGCKIDEVLMDIRSNLASNIVPIQQVYNQGTRDSAVSELFQVPVDGVCEFLADYDEKWLYKFLNNKPVSEPDIRESIVSLSRNTTIYPVIFGSALQGTGIRPLCKSIKLFLPPQPEEAECRDEASWIVFKINRSAENIKQVYIRVFSGVVNLWDTFGSDKITKIQLLRNGGTEVVKSLPAGEIGIIHGLNNCKINDSFGNVSNNEFVKLGRPTLRYAVTTLSLSDKRKMMFGISRIAESDPYLEYELNDEHGDMFLNLFGEIQMEIIKDILAQEYHVGIEFQKPEIIYKEAVKGEGKSFMKMFQEKNPYYATLGIKVEPNLPKAGNIVKSDVSTSNFPKGFQKGALDGIRCYLRQGLKGWEITDTIITITEGEFDSITSTTADYRNLAPMVLFEALEKAGTKLLWPILKFDIKIPERYYGKITNDLVRMRGEISDISEKSGNYILTGTVPAENFQDYNKVFIDNTNGTGNISSVFDSYEEAPRGIEKTGRKIYPDPLNKFQYIMSKKATGIRT